MFLLEMFQFVFEFVHIFGMSSLFECQRILEGLNLLVSTSQLFFQLLYTCTKTGHLFVQSVGTNVHHLQRGLGLVQGVQRRETLLDLFIKFALQAGDLFAHALLEFSVGVTFGGKLRLQSGLLLCFLTQTGQLSLTLRLLLGLDAACLGLLLLTNAFLLLATLPLLFLLAAQLFLATTQFSLICRTLAQTFLLLAAGSSTNVFDQLTANVDGTYSVDGLQPALTSQPSLYLAHHLKHVVHRTVHQILHKGQFTSTKENTRQAHLKIFSSFQIKSNQKCLTESARLQSRDLLGHQIIVASVQISEETTSRVTSLHDHQRFQHTGAAQLRHAGGCVDEGRLHQLVGIDATNKVAAGGGETGHQI
mmetsp:Transcript_33449/g.83978  ORF Transcript_33449/g.83978 Transcript_33449/m.83978 type:complete len:362 (-) Transcript_33449:2143-3228(-)